MLEWHKLSIERIVSGKTENDTPFLKLFLQDYAKKFNQTSLNPACNSCMREYYKKWCQHITEMANDCKYKLQPKYEGIQLSRGSNTIVTNANITDALGGELFKTRGASVFLKYPKTTKDEPTIVEPQMAALPKTEIVEPAGLAPKLNRKPRKKKR